jgi:translation initiation factor IF-2
VTITSSKIIYRLTEEVTERVIALLPSTMERRVTGEATVAQVFEIDGKGGSKINIAGCRITDGHAEKSKRVTVMRNDKAVHEGTVETLRILRKDVLEVKKGTECGIGLEGFNDVKEGDIIQFHHEVEIPGVL